GSAKSLKYQDCRCKPSKSANPVPGTPRRPVRRLQRFAHKLINNLVDKAPGIEKHALAAVFCAVTC
ncbi:hypothetical protein ABTL27_19750, partial [Acinetobacter baumannii]